MRKLGVVALALVVSTSLMAGQERRPMSPPGSATTMVGGKWTKTDKDPEYEGGKWIEITAGRPMLRQRTGVFGSGAEYGKTIKDDAPVWRAGANMSTRLKTEVPLEIGGKVVPAGEYSLFIDLKSEKDWTLVVSSHAAQTKYDRNDTTALWGGYKYTADKDVARAPMRIDNLPFAVEQLTWGFTDVTENSGTIRLWWDKTMASVPFKVATTS